MVTEKVYHLMIDDLDAKLDEIKNEVRAYHQAHHGKKYEEYEDKVLDIIGYVLEAKRMTKSLRAARIDYDTDSDAELFDSVLKSE